MVQEKGYHFSADAADALYAASCGLYTTLPRDNNAKLLVTVAADQLLHCAKTSPSWKPKC